VFNGDGDGDLTFPYSTGVSACRDFTYVQWNVQNPVLYVGVQTRNMSLQNRHMLQTRPCVLAHVTFYHDMAILSAPVRENTARTRGCPGNGHVHDFASLVGNFHAVNVSTSGI
jgi:hypothetical protein